MAEKIRVGLEAMPPEQVSKPEPGVLDELLFRKPVRQHVREFAALFALICLGIAGVLEYRGRSHGTPFVLSLLAAALIFLGYKTPALLHPVWKAWMAFAHVLGAVMTLVILTLGWCFMVVPLGAALKAFGVRVMDTTFRERVDSYWESRDPKYDDFKLLERQY